MLSGVHRYRSTLDRLTYTNAEGRPISMEFGVAYLERSLNLG